MKIKQRRFVEIILVPGCLALVDLDIEILGSWMSSPIQFNCTRAVLFCIL